MAANKQSKVQPPADAEGGTVMMEYTGRAGAPVPYRVGGQVYRGDTNSNRYVEVRTEHVAALEELGQFKRYTPPATAEKPAEKPAATDTPEVFATIVDGATGQPVAESIAVEAPAEKRSRKA